MTDWWVDWLSDWRMGWLVDWGKVAIATECFSPVSNQPIELKLFSLFTLTYGRRMSVAILY